ncbi:MAG: dTDP-4-dehydrorhamnose 3,5-epimerase [Akkermansiaceae bacterium]
MTIYETGIEGVALIEPKVFGDSRGFFVETYQHERYQDIIGSDLQFVQDNHSRSQMGVLRGLHFQTSRPQGKLVRCVSGSVFDVAVDIRKDSPTYGKWFGAELSAENKHQMWVAPGLAHGFLVLTDTADFEYKCTDYYDPSGEGCLKFDDPTVGIDWPSVATDLQLSEKDLKGLALSEI